MYAIHGNKKLLEYLTKILEKNFKVNKENKMLNDVSEKIKGIELKPLKNK